MAQTSPIDHGVPAERVVGPTTTIGYPSQYPTIGRAVPEEDWWLLWGPLGVMSAIFLTALVMAVRSYRSDVRDKDQQIRDLNEKLLEQAEEHARSLIAQNEKLHTVTMSVRDMAQSVADRIVRPG